MRTYALGMDSCCEWQVWVDQGGDGPVFAIRCPALKLKFTS